MKQRFIKYVCLNILGELAISFYILADTFFIAQGIGNKGLTALNLAIPVFNLIYGIGLMLGMGSGIRLSILKIENKQDEINQLYTHVLLFGLSVGIVFIIIALLFSKNISILLGADHLVLKDTNTYLRTIMLFTPAFIINNALNGLVRNDHNPTLATTAMIVASLMNVLLDYIFIFIFHMGMFGAVFATCLAPIIGICILSFHFITKKNTFHLAPLHFTPRMLLRISQLGFSTMFIEVSNGLVVLLFNKLILNISGNIGVAAYGVVCNIWMVCIALFNGLAEGMQPLTSEAYGHKNKENLNTLRHWALSISLILSMIIYAGLFFNAGYVTSLFNSSHNITLARLATDGFKIMFIGLFFAGLNIILSTFFTSIENSKCASMIILLRGVVLIIPIAIILSHIGMIGIWSSLPLAELVTTIIGLLYLRLKYLKE